MNSKNIARTLDYEYTIKGCNYLTTLYSQGKHETIATLQSEIPIDFIQEHKYIGNEREMLYAFLEDYERYRDIHTFEEYKAIRHGEQIISDIANHISTPIDMFMQRALRAMETERYLENILDTTNNKYSQVAIYIAILNDIIDEDLIDKRIPGACKLYLRMKSHYFKGYTREFNKYRVLKYRNLILEKDRIVAVELCNSKLIELEKVKALLQKKLPFAMLKEDGYGLEGIYLHEGSIRRFYPYVKEGGLICQRKKL